MFKPIREFRHKLASGQFCLGVGITFSDPAVTEALAGRSDFFWIDLEHTAMSLETLQSHLIAARAVSVPALVRVPGSEPWFIKRVLDTGAHGVIVPQVRSTGEVRQVVAACRYQPQGDRGYGPRRASHYGRDVRSYLETVNQDLFVAVQIENVDALNSLEAIVAVSGLDSIVIGPQDLAASMGLMGQVTHPEVEKAIERIISQTHAAGLFIGMGGGPDEACALRAARLGVQWMQCGSDFSYMIQYVDQLFASISADVARLRHPEET